MFLQRVQLFSVSPNASANLELALSAKIDVLPNPYDPLAALTLFYASARNQITTSSKVVPAILATINPLLTQAATAHTAQYLLALNSSSSAPNALSLAVKACPQCLAGPFALNQTDLIPFSSAPAVATGSTMVGLIFLLTFAFSVFNILRNAASTTVIGIRLCIRDALVLRTVNALAAYLILALWYTLINLTFGVPMDFGDGTIGTSRGNGGKGRGLMLYWMLNWCTMASVGLPMEGLLTLIGLRWSGYFLTFCKFVFRLNSLFRPAFSVLRRVRKESSMICSLTFFVTEDLAALTWRNSSHFISWTGKVRSVEHALLIAPLRGLKGSSSMCRERSLLSN